MTGCSDRSQENKGTVELEPIEQAVLSSQMSHELYTLSVKHEPLISRELFEQAQAARSKTAAKYVQNEKASFTPNIFRGRIFCGHCGKALHRQKSRDQYFFRCISNDRIGPGTCPGDIRVLPEDDLIATVLTIVRKEAAVIMGAGYRLKQNGETFTLKADLKKQP